MTSAQPASDRAGQAAARGYRLSLHPSVESFRPELEFACSFLDRSYPVRRVEGEGQVLHYGPEPPPGAVAVPAVLFPGAVRVDGDGIRPQREGLARAENGSIGALLPPAAEAMGAGPARAAPSLAYDALGLIFLLLSRLEERGHPDKDRYGRFAVEASLQWRRARPDAPLADSAARDLAAALLGTASPPTNGSYRVWLTHDVDSLRGYHHPIGPLRNALGDLLKRGDPGAALRRLKRGYLGGDPWRSCRQVMELSERHGFTSRFYFMGPTRDEMDSPYVLREPGVVRRLADEMLARGHKVGFHPGFRTCGNADEWRRQKDGLEAVLGRPLSEGRHHGLMFDAETTWDLWDEGGMEMDASLGYPQPSGFRSGTCRAHPTYSLRRRRALDLLAYPSAIMDFGFFGGRYRDLTVDQALAECRRVVEICRSHGGDLVVLYHPTQVSPETRLWYGRLLEGL